ncbi:MAG: NirA family protein [Planctomycetota bacterium]
MCGTPNTQSEAFTPEQQAYLDQFVASLDLQATFSSPPAGEPQPVTIHGTPYEDLCKEEVAKHERHPWDFHAVMRDHVQAGKMPEGTDVFMFKHQGMFNVAPAMPGFMCRLRIPGCKMRGDQLRGLGDMARDLAGGYAHVTTRGNLQLREIPAEHLLNTLTGLQSIGLTSRGSGADSVRNITASPTAGFDPLELTNLLPYAVELHHYILQSRDLHGIPRKFNISFDNGGSISCVSDTNDIAYLATNVQPSDALPADVLPGVYCRVLLGGITGHKDFARDTGVVVKPEHTVDVSVAMLHVFIEHGDRTNRKKARLKYVLDQHGFDWFLDRTTEKLEEMGSDAKLIRLSPEHDAPRQPIDRQGHIGVHPQKQDGMKYIGVALPLGKLTVEQLHGLGDIAAQFGSNDIRLTVWQNLLIPDVPEEKVDDALAAIHALGIATSASSFAAGAVACTGRFGCKFASAHTKEHAGLLVEHLQQKFELDSPINIHLTGCSHSCAQHYIGDIGLLGASTADGREAYQVFLGGGSDHDQGLAQHLTGPVAADELPLLLEVVVGRYLEHRNPDETFLAFTRRHTPEQLAEFFLKPASELAEVA